MKNNNAYLQHILLAIKYIETFLDHVSEKKFSHDVLIQSAVIRQLEIIGEAVRNLPVEIKKSHPHVPWKEIAGLRNKLIHEYSGVNLEVVWKTLETYLPALKPKIERLLRKK